MKRDLKINYSKIANISNQINSYKSALETMENSLKSIKDALEAENSGDAIKSLIDNYNSLESYISSCKGELEDLYNLFGGYYYDMTAIIRPINEASIMQVDRDDIWFNMQSIKGEISEIGNLNNSYSSLDYSYANPMYYPSANEEDKKNSEENYRKIEEIKEKIKSSAKKIKGYEEAMDSLFNNKIVHYENMDDEYASKAKLAYNKYASAEEVDYISAVNARDDIKNFFTGVYNSFKGLVEGTVELFLGTCMYATGAAVLLTGKEELSDSDKDNISAFHKGNEMLGAILEDPELILEGISQQVSDDFDQKGIAYSTGSLAGLVAQIAITKKVKVEFTKLGLSDEILSKGKILINGEEVSMAEILAKRGVSSKTTSMLIEKLDTGDLEKLYKYLEKKPVGFKCDDIIDRIEKGESVDDILKGAADAKDFYRKNPADPIRDVLGSGLKSSPVEWNKLIDIMKDNGVEIVYRDGTMAYSPGLVPGAPGQLIIDKNASMSALIHEYQHYLDDVASGLPGMRQLYEQNPRVIKELRAYMKEIKIADELGLKDVSAQLWENYRQEREYILNLFKE